MKQYVWLAAAVVVFCLLAVRLTCGATNRLPLAWDNPTAYMDGSALPAARIERTWLYAGTWMVPLAGPTNYAAHSRTQAVWGAVALHYWTNVWTGRWYVQARTRDIDGLESDLSNRAVWSDVRPRPPTLRLLTR